MDDVTMLSAPVGSSGRETPEEIRLACESLTAEIERVRSDLARAHDEVERAQTEEERCELLQAEVTGGWRARSRWAQHRIDQLTIELETVRSDGGSPAALRLFIDALEQLRLDFDRLSRQSAATRQALRELREDITAALAGLVRPGPALDPPSAIIGGKAKDYLLLARSGLMDGRWYQERYLDLSDVEVDPVLHYLEDGWLEGRRPGPLFDGGSYLAGNPDVANQRINPLLHYQTAGVWERRPLTPLTGDFDDKREGARSAPRWFNPIRIVIDLTDYQEYQDFRRARPEAFKPATETAVKTSALTLGTRSEFLGDLGPEHSHVGTGDLRECLSSGGLNSRTRAIADVLIDELRLAGRSEQDARIYGHEAITYLADLMRRRFPGFVGTEFAPDGAARRRLLPFFHNDICASQFPDESFDATLSCDVLEHVYDRDAALREAARTTVTGGVLLATFPFFFDMERGSVFAELIDGEIIHHLETPIYHGNPVDQEGGSLVFEIPGWDIIERARLAGFSRAAMRYICDEEKGVTASGEGRPDGPRGVFVLVAHK